MSLDEPKYVQLKEFIKSYIKQGELQPDDKMYSENELADRFTISRHTVRKAIGELVNEGWLYRVQGKGTFVSNPEGSLKEKSKLIGVVTTYLKDYIFPDIIHGMDEVLSKEGYSILLGNTNNEFEKERITLLNMLNTQLAGLIIEPTKSVFPNPNIDLYERFLNRNIPILFIHGYYSNFPASYVVEDDVLAGYMATKYLIDQGHRKIAGIFKSDDLQGHGRFRGFVKAHREHEIPISEASITWFATEDRESLFGNKTSENIIIKRIHNCSALVCYNDQIAIGVLELLRENNIKVPEGCSIISFDNSELAQSSEVRLTTVAHPKEGLGAKAAKGMIDLIHHKKNTIQKEIEPQLIIRDSVTNRNT